MKCACIQNDYNFLLDYTDCQEVIYKDSSKWMEGDAYELPSTYDVTVSSPIQSGATITVYANGSTSLSTSDFGLPSECFPDGFYTFSTESCGVTYSKNIAILCTLDCCLQDMIARSTVQDLPKINQLRFYIEASKTQAEAGNYEQFQTFYSLAKDHLKAYNCKCKCA